MNCWPRLLIHYLYQDLLKARDLKPTKNFVVISITVAGTALLNAQSDLAALNDVIAQVEASLNTTHQRIENVSADRNDQFIQLKKPFKITKIPELPELLIEMLFHKTSDQTFREQLAFRQQAGEEI
ncbi:unnamed protein product [Paramecium primaurelia]|uniref:Uncharacterized protein n=1 Tax=Paramecium primaurelia TaxID=5886 RepID=A0A8S1PLB7_PARPR|nr:unnamed protein product [Paramecium primaurelia]